GLASESAFSFVRLGQIVSRSPDHVRALWQHAFSTRISPHFPDVNAIGSLFALGTVCWLTIALGQKLSPRNRAGAIAGTLVMAVTLWLTGSRAALGAAVLTGFLMWWQLRRPSLTTMAATLAIAGTIGLSLVTANAARTPRASIETASSIRLELAMVGIRIAAAHPWFGVGLGEFSAHSTQYISPQLIEQFPQAAYGENAHNELIQVLGELGLIGLVVFVWYWIVVLAPPLRRFRAFPADHGKSDPWLLAWTSGLCAFHLSALLGHPFLTPYVVYCVFLSVGVVAGLSPDESRTLSRRS
ncbi:MAG TPA: O-antigen ligase family protein, partial [Vicinamibacterales bacterium]|nr:O-antigen ligase family protein [Vicinamibacterales bacterium]